ncbi:hypothetical protein HK104_002269 [Borealophlyctis nickersoniae]|nr:hypothetical protein HK104_002269 [Borealophlyctis nickersoniae]
MAHLAPIAKTQPEAMPTPRLFSVAIITISDRVAANEAEDRTGPALVNLFKENAEIWGVEHTSVVPDEVLLIQSVVKRAADARVNLIVTTGGTGFGVRDVTPEAIAPLLIKQAAGLTTAMLTAGLKKTPMAALSRPVCGVCNRSLVVTLPGSVRGATENLEAILGVLPHALELIAGGEGAGEETHKRMQSGRAPPVEDESSSQKAPSLQHHRHHHHHHHHHRPKHGTSTAAGLAPPVATRARSSPYPMIAFDDAVSIVLSHAPILPAEQRRVTHGLIGHVLAADIVAKEAVPAYRASIVDGYAVLAPDGPGEYPVITSATAGGAPEVALQPGQIARVTTGAPVPAGATAVVMVEYTTVVKASEDGQVEHVVGINTKVQNGENIREVGSDIGIGQVVLKKGDVVTAVGGEIGVMASVGVLEALVHRKPIVALLSTGNEVKEFDTPAPLTPGAIRDSNRPTLAAAIVAAGFEALDLGIAGDSPEVLASSIRKGLERADVLITTGGVSMGEMDLLKPVLEKMLGATIHFGRVALKPGKPTTFAVIPPAKEGDPPKLVFALPGNPVSANVTFYLFVLPALRKMAAYAEPRLPIVKAQIAHPLPLDSRPEFQRAHLSIQTTASPLLGATTTFVAHGTGSQRSSRLLSMCGANALLRLPPATEGKREVASGEVVDAIVIGGL